MLANPAIQPRGHDFLCEMGRALYRSVKISLEVYLLNITFLSGAWMHRTIIPGTQEVETGGSQAEGQSEKLSET